MSIKIEKGAPSPPPPRSKSEEFLVALRDMQPGESFLWNVSSANRIALSVAKTLLGRTFMTRREGSNTFRVWRIQ